MSDGDDQVLDLNEEDIAPLGRAVRIGDQTYRTVNPNTLGLVALFEMQQLETQFGEAMRRLQANPADGAAAQEAEKVLDAIIRKTVPDLPDAEFAKLGVVQKTKIYAFFNGRLATFKEAVGRAMTAQSTTPTSSQG